MKFQVLLKTLIIPLAALSFGASADLEKTPLKVNFSNLIDQSNEQRAELESGINTHYEIDETILEAEGSQKVIDFVDVEIGWGVNEKVVDRRYNSAEEPQPANAIDVEIQKVKIKEKESKSDEVSRHSTKDISLVQVEIKESPVPN